MPNTQYISRRVRELVKKHGTRDPFELCDALSVNVSYKELGTRIKAYFFYQSRIRTVVLNSGADKNIHKTLCAHELGHAMLHSDMLAAMRGFAELELFDRASRTEYEANLFAAELLIPDGELLELIECEGRSLFDAAAMLCVPAELIDFKLRILKDKGYMLDVPYIARSDFLKNI